MTGALKWSWVCPVSRWHQIMTLRRSESENEYMVRTTYSGGNRTRLIFLPESLLLRTETERDSLASRHRHGQRLGANVQASEYLQSWRCVMSKVKWKMSWNRCESSSFKFALISTDFHLFVLLEFNQESSRMSVTNLRPSAWMSRIITLERSRLAAHRQVTDLRSICPHHGGNSLWWKNKTTFGHVRALYLNWEFKDSTKTQSIWSFNAFIHPFNCGRCTPCSSQCQRWHYCMERKRMQWWWRG